VHWAGRAFLSARRGAGQPEGGRPPAMERGHRPNQVAGVSVLSVAPVFGSL
jgi:hypothetical protein